MGQMAWRHLPLVYERLLSLGYSWYDESEDSEYIQRLAQSDPDEFKELTGYHVPDHMDHVVCEACGVCTPDVCKLILMDNDDCVHP